MKSIIIINALLFSSSGFKAYAQSGTSDTNVMAVDPLGVPTPSGCHK